MHNNGAMHLTNMEIDFQWLNEMEFTWNLKKIQLGLIGEGSGLHIVKRWDVIEPWDKFVRNVVLLYYIQWLRVFHNY
jgi:hypothetical protein